MQVVGRPHKKLMVTNFERLVKVVGWVYKEMYSSEWMLVAGYIN